MATCFIFAQYFDEENALSLRLNDLGQMDAPLARRTIDELRLLQTHARTIIVLPSMWCSLHTLELSWLGERKMREAIPYALEDEIAENVTTLHFAFDRQHMQNNGYLVIVIDKQIMIDLKERLLALHITYDTMTIDWFALEAGEVCVSEQGLLIADADFKGALGLELIPYYLQKHQQSPFFIFNDSPLITTDCVVTPIQSSFYVWVAERLFKKNALNLCQGEFKQQIRLDTRRRWYEISIILLSTWLLSLLFINGLKVYKLNHHLTMVNQQTASIYHDFFPQAQQIISPRFRITEWLKSHVSNSNQVLWSLLNKLADAFQQQRFVIEQMRFQNQTLTIVISCSNFAILEQLESYLQQKNVHVKQVDAATHTKNIVATLALTL